MLVFTSKLPTRLLWRCRQNFSAIFRCEKYSQITDKEKTAVKFAHLGHRQIISLEGRDASTFLQGIVTNDVTLLPEMKCMYGMILNQHGRVLYDVIMYHQQSDKFDKILVECEKESAESLIKTLKLYKLRKKLTITPQENVKIYQADASDLEVTFNPTSGEILASNLDPRVPLLGHRILVENMSEDNLDITWDLSNYHHRRYMTGIPEGIADLPPGNCLPLESNLDYMNGVSFHKGCYIGQELTARTKFTGVIRKRLLPVTLEGKGQIEPGETIYNPKGRSAGKFRSMHHGGDVGLALVRLNYAEEKLMTKNGDFVLKAHTPTWWPFKDGTEFSDGVCGPNVEENV